MNREYRSYKLIYFFASLVFRPLYRIKTTGRENIPDGAAIICPMHSHWADPVFMALSIGKRHHLHIVGKAELFSTRLLARIFNSAGAISVKRGDNDIAAVRKMMKYLKNGEKLLIFPEGTRVKAGCESRAKRGATYLSYKLNVPIVPVYLPREKKAFHTVEIVIGKPYYVGGDTYGTSASDELLQKMLSLGRKI